jgi:hypothetical protein
MKFCSKKLTPPSGFYCCCLKPELVLEEIAMERPLVSCLILKCNLRIIIFFLSVSSLYMSAFLISQANPVKTAANIKSDITLDR